MALLKPSLLSWSKTLLLALLVSSFSDLYQFNGILEKWRILMKDLLKTWDDISYKSTNLLIISKSLYNWTFNQIVHKDFNSLKDNITL